MQGSARSYEKASNRLASQNGVSLLHRYVCEIPYVKTIDEKKKARERERKKERKRERERGGGKKGEYELV